MVVVKMGEKSGLIKKRRIKGDMTVVMLCPAFAR
jgi:hypothetical protein